MAKTHKTVVNVEVKNLVVVNREIATNDKPAGAGMLKKVGISMLCYYLPLVVSEVYNWMSFLNIS